MASRFRSTDVPSLICPMKPWNLASPAPSFGLGPTCQFDVETEKSPWNASSAPAVDRSTAGNCSVLNPISKALFWAVKADRADYLDHLSPFSSNQRRRRMYCG